ncbi:MAG: hypothetical protein OEQ28_06825 [Acidobacteriota bacterium]|nr:hypothetical protein [Acidobacteriota bacterium]
MVIKRVIAFLFAIAFVIGAHQLVSTDVNAAGNDLAVLLPDSDGVIVLDSKRLVHEALPQLLSSNLPLLEKINGELEKIKSRSGLDLRKFSSVAIGLKNKAGREGENEFDVVILARGDVSVGSLEDLARLASKGKYKKQKSGPRTIYVFSPGDLIKSNSKSPRDKSFIEGITDKLFKGLSEEIAITAYDSNTVAFGSLERVKETIGNKPRVNSELLALLERKPGSLANMGMFVPNGMSQYLELEDDELGANLDSIRQLQGSFDVIDGITSVSVAAKTNDADKAEELAGTLQAIRGMFAGILKSNGSTDKQVYGRMLESLEVTQVEREIFVDLSVPKSDLDILIGKK